MTVLCTIHKSTTLHPIRHNFTSKIDKGAKYCARPMAVRMPDLRWPTLVMCDGVTAWSHRRVSCPFGRLRAWTQPSDPSIVVTACCRIAWPHEVRPSQSPWCQPSTGQGNHIDWFELFPQGESLFPEDCASLVSC